MGEGRNDRLFSPGQARRYIREKLAVGEGSPVLQGVDLLVEDLQFLPLALAQAAASMLDRSETCASYRRRYADRKRTLAELFPADALADDYQATVARHGQSPSTRLTPSPRLG